MVWPSTLSSFTDPTPTDRLSTTPHSSIETAQNNGIRELQAFVGSSSSAVGTLMYDIRGSGSDGGGHVQTANKGGTGQTAYTKGDVLVATSSSVIGKVAVSSVEGYALITDSTQAAGVRWGIPGNIPAVRFYSATSASTLSWTKPSIFSYIIVEVSGAGGGSQGVTTVNILGQGGGHGGYGRKLIPASAIGTASVTGLIGTAGGGGVGAAGLGSVGGISTFGGFMTAQGGAGATAGESGGKAADGSVLGGDINITGGGGLGGPSVSSDSSNDVPGIAGQPGYVTVTEY